MDSVSITTGARLHFGPLSVAAPAGGRFGGIGVMIDSPCTVLAARIATHDSVESDAVTAARVSQFVQQIRQSANSTSFPRCEIKIQDTIPSHCGFGSGTQLGLAVARALSILANEPDQSLGALARRVGRGFRSAIGLYGFDRGGFLVDGGRVTSDQLGTLVCRVDFPNEWRFVLAAPRQSTGLSGEAEQTAFDRQPAMPASLTAELCRIVLMDWLPSVIEADFQRCGESMYAFGHAVGEFFVPAQGGVFAHPRMSKWAELLRRRGVEGVAQTSWGPTIAALFSSEKAAEQLRSDFANDAAWTDCSFAIAAPLNRGARVIID